MIVARSFAPAFEVALKKQGVLPLRFADADDYARVSGFDRLSLPTLAEQLQPGKPLLATFTRGARPASLPLPLAPGAGAGAGATNASAGQGGTPGSSFEVELRHSLTAEQLAWFRAGSALNAAAAALRAAAAAAAPGALGAPAQPQQQPQQQSRTTPRT